MRQASGISLRIVALAILLGIPQHARAHALEPRTPVVWTGAPCMTTIDRTRSGPIVSLEYTIPFEDIVLTENEPPDGRRHQFFSFCRDHYPEDLLPRWISEADVEVALGLGLGDVSLVEFEHDILDNAIRWQDCFMRITEDDERRPITFEAAAEPVAWDTSGLPAGTYAVEGYTWDPWFNLWTEHPGVFRLVDDPDPAANPPAAALTSTEQIVEVGQPAQIEGCVEAMPGSTMTLSWALGGSGAEPPWEVVAADVPVESNQFEFELLGPEAAVGRYVLVSLEVVDPLDRTWTAYSRGYIGVIAGPSEETTDESAEGESAGESESETGMPTETGTELGSSELGSGCACSSAGSSGGWPLGWFGVLLAFWGSRAERNRRFQSTVGR